MRANRIVPCLLAVAVAAAGCGRKGPGAAGGKTDRRVAVRVQSAASRSFERRLTVLGTLEAKNFANVASRVAGNLDEIWVDEGDFVVAGKTPLFQIDPTARRNALTIAEQALSVSKASLAAARASAEKAEAEFRKASLDFARYERLHKDGMVTDNEYESRQVAHEQARTGATVARAQVELGERQVAQAEAALAIARKDLADTRVLAPISGVVSSRTAEPGEQMSVGRVVLRIDDLSTVEAAAFVPAQYYAEVIPGTTRFRLEIGGKDLGMQTVAYRGPTINTTLRTFEIKVKVKAGRAAVPGSMARLTVVFASRTAVGVPSSAVLVRAGAPLVFVVADGKAAARKVETGLQTDAWTEILSGIAPGDQVVVQGQTQVHDGDPVEVI